MNTVEGKSGRVDHCGLYANECGGDSGGMDNVKEGTTVRERLGGEDEKGGVRGVRGKKG